MRRIEQLELPLREVLKEATIAPDEADLAQLLNALDEALPKLDTVGQLQVGAEAIAQWMTKQQVSIAPLVELQQSTRIPLIQLWLALLLGGFTLQQRGEFYETEQIWVLG